VKIGRAAGVTDTGRRRLRNEDAFIFKPPLFAVADGMGGARAGEVASGLAAAAFEEAGGATQGTEGVAALIVEANRRIWERSVADPRTAGMGTTVTAALVDAAAGTVAIGHVGDSRAYLLRDGELDQLTTDHSLVAELVQSGVLTPEEAERHPQRSAITRALGTEETVEVESFTVAAKSGDVFLLCSDGLSTMLDDTDITSAIADAGDDLEKAADALIAAANARGGEDNVTVVLFELLAEDAPLKTTPKPAAGTAEAEITLVDMHAPEAADGDAQRPQEATRIATQVKPEPVPPPEPERRHGAGPGGRIAALVLVLLLLGLGVFALYWIVVR
jgi:PPM family protein phosphatase